jgi:uncharacterized protein (TIGR02594 family)
MTNDPKWLTEARKLIGLREVPGPASAPEIVQMWRDIKRGGIKDDATPWCAAFVGAMLERAGVRSSRYESAASYLTWGAKLAAPAYGCVAVFSREGGGHVGFVVGQTVTGDLLILGGNQSDQVNVRTFARSRVTGYRWPAGVPLDTRPLSLASAEKSRSEA